MRIRFATALAVLALSFTPLPIAQILIAFGQQPSLDDFEKS